MKIYLFVLVFLAQFSIFARADIIGPPRLPLDARQNPSGVDWLQLSSDHFDVIYPEGLTAEARDVTAMLETLYAPVAEGLKVAPPRLKIVLQAHTLQSNGFVTLAPRRSEWYLTPMMGPDIGQTEWLKTLAVHEFRHVVQFDKSRTGFAKALRFILGETGTALAIGFTLPPWYMEGDAVGIETALSSSGRGRQPLFERDWRTLLLDNQEFTYDQLALGSFKRWRPNHYVIGYFLTTYLRRHYGKDILEKIHFETMERAYNPLAFYNAIERYTGKSFDHIYKETVRELKKLWKTQLQSIDAIAVSEVKTPATEDWVSYSYPNKLGDDTIAFREGLGFIGQYVRLHDGKEEVLWTPGPLAQEFPHKIRQGKIATAEVQLHPRWGIQDFTHVRVRDLNSQDIVFEKSTENWLLPVLDHSAKRLAIFDWKSTGDPALKIVNLSNGKIDHSLGWPRTQPILGMDWIPASSKLLLLVRDGVYRLTLMTLDVESGERKTIASSEKGNWAYPTASETHAFIQSAASGIDNIHRISLTDGKEEKVTSETYGAYHPAIVDGELIYSRYTARGLKPVRLSSLATSAVGESTHVPYYESLVDQENKGDLLSQSQPLNLKPENYSLAKNALNGHSWLLLAPPFGSSIVAQIRSTDILNTLDWTNGVVWDLNEQEAMGFSTLRWSYGWPILDFGVAYGRRRQDLEYASGEEVEDSWEEGSSELGLSVPWTSLHGRWLQNARLRGYGLALHSRGRIAASIGDLTENTLAGGGIEADWSWLHRTSQRDLLPPWGVVLSGSAISATDTQRPSSESYQRYGAIQWYGRGLLKHHHLYGEAASETQPVFGYQFSSPVRFSRGLSNRFLEQKQKTSVNYAFPLAYPEWNAGRYFYLKRISFNAFYDNVWGRRYFTERRFESRGAELWFDTNFVRNFFGIQWGLRWSAPVDTREEQSWELFINTGLVTW